MIALRNARKHRLAAVFAIAAAVLIGLGTWFTVEASGLRSSPSANNEALVDQQRTAEVNAGVTRALNTVFSYAFDDVGTTGKAASEVLRGQALDTYRDLFARVREQAPEQRLSLTTQVVSSAVLSLTGDRATVLAFLDQSATRADGKPGVAAAQLLVTAQREGEGWVITELAPR
ncbi:hypothetical protein ABZ639_12435 [Saccharomonospora sp. NPDC006951]